MIHNVNTRCLPLMGILLWAAIGSLPAMAGNDIGNAVQVQSITSESAGAFLRVKVELVNTSRQPITAYTLRATVTPESGQPAQSEITRDMVWVLVHARLGQPLPAGSEFGPGQVTTSTIDVPIDANAGYPADATPVLKAAAAVTMVAFADKTAWGSAKAIESLMHSRANSVDEANDLITALGGLRGARDIPAALRALVSEAQSNKAQTSPTVSGRLLAERRLSALRAYAAPLADHPEALALATKVWQTRYEILREHSSLRRIETGVERLEEDR